MAVCTDKENRHLTVRFLFQRMNAELLEFDSSYNKEKVFYRCQCGVEHRTEFHFVLTKLKYKKFCDCGVSIPEDLDPDFFTLEKWTEDMKMWKKEAKEKLFKKGEFFAQENDKVAMLLIENRAGRFMTNPENDEKKYRIMCQHKHVFDLSLNELLKQKWCPTCCKASVNYWEEY